MQKTIVNLYIAILCLTAHSQTVRYSPSWFGPNANPVPEFTEARLPQHTTIGLMADYYFGYGDETKNGRVKIEVPLLSERVSYGLWVAFLESYKVEESLAIRRGMPATQRAGIANGDFYVQTRIKLLSESRMRPDIVLNTTLKTASGTNFQERRYFDTPGYYFDLEIGKNVYSRSNSETEIRVVGDIGFLCWETSGSRQNDAPMYGAKLIHRNKHWKLENTLSGYWGWMHNKFGDEYGDRPLVYAAKISYLSNYLSYFVQFQHGILDFPYDQVRVGMAFALLPRHNRSKTPPVNGQPD